MVALPQWVSTVISPTQILVVPATYQSSPWLTATTYRPYKRGVSPLSVHVWALYKLYLNVVITLTLGIVKTTYDSHRFKEFKCSFPLWVSNMGKWFSLNLRQHSHDTYVGQYPVQRERRNTWFSEITTMIINCPRHLFRDYFAYESWTVDL